MNFLMESQFYRSRNPATTVADIDVSSRLTPNSPFLDWVCAWGGARGEAFETIRRKPSQTYHLTLRVNLLSHNPQKTARNNSNPSPKHNP